METKMKTEMQKFVEDSARTMNSDHKAIAKRLSDPKNIDLLHATMGMSTEANELVDQMKKVIFYGKPMDTANIVEELGDVLFYVAIVCRELNVSMERIGEINIAKLKKRYPDAFSEENALNRDLDAERKILEGSGG